MAIKLWNKQKQKQLNAVVEQFETGDDLILDNYLLSADILGSLAHARMLVTIGILTKQEFNDIQISCNQILDLAKKGEFTLTFGDEDIHTKIENAITEKYTDAGKKIHTGRSRNDQVLLDLRLYTKEQLLEIWETILVLTNTVIQQAKLYEFIPMPGYTHTQKAMPSSVGMWLGAFAESLLDSLIVFQTAFQINNQSPLGAAAAYGSTLPIDRQMVSDLLGFAKVQNNSLYSQNSRGKIENIIVFALMQIVGDISRFAADVVLFTSSEYGYFTVDSSLTTGSSIMPQKKNVDIAELLRSKIHIIHGFFTQILGITATLPSGYNRDYQDTKKPFFQSLGTTVQSIQVCTLLVAQIKPNEERLQKAMTPELFATAAAYDLVAKGMSFREAYKQIGNNLESLQTYNVDEALHKSKHLGGTGNLGLDKIQQNINTSQEESALQKSNYQSMKEAILSFHY